jgi:hypothetical protein
MAELLANVPKLVVPDAGSLIVGSQATPELMAFLNEIARFANITRGLDVPAVADITPDQLADDFGIVWLSRGYDEESSVQNSTSTISGAPPQISEGTEYQSLSFTPKRDDSRILIEWKGMHYAAGGASTLITLCRSGQSDVLATESYTTTTFETKVLRREIDSWGTTAETISVRHGTAGSGTSGIGLAAYGNTIIQTLTVTEFMATPIPA